MRDHPLLTILGRRGRSAIVEVLRDKDQAWTIRGLAREAGVPPATAQRAVQELEALGAVESLRPGRDAQVRFRRDTEMGKAILWLRIPDVRAGACKAFAQAFGRPEGVRQLLRWSAPGDVPSDPMTPTRIAVVCRDVDDAIEAVGPALDAVRVGGWPAPDVTVLHREELDPDDPLAEAILEGQPLA